MLRQIEFQHLSTHKSLHPRLIWFRASARSTNSGQTWVINITPDYTEREVITVSYDPLETMLDRYQTWMKVVTS